MRVTRCITKDASSAPSKHGKSLPFIFSISPRPAFFSPTLVLVSSSVLNDGHDATLIVDCNSHHHGTPQVQHGASSW